jgi:hypothetical protein
MVKINNMRLLFLLREYHLTIGFVFISSVLVSAQDFVKGSIITSNNDTVLCSIVKLKKREEVISRYKELQIIDSLGIIKKLYPKDIYAYIKDGVTYKSIKIEGIDVFMEMITDGRVVLYFYGGGDAGKAKYIFKRSDENYFNVLDITTRSFKLIGVDENTRGRRSEIRSIDKDMAFSIFFSDYFKDCLMLSRKIKLEFYTSADMIDMFEEYNQTCGKGS